MKSYKDRFLAAIQETTELHQKVVDGKEERLKGFYTSCPLCCVYIPLEKSCKGCPLYNGVINENGCDKFKTYPYNSNAYRDEDDERSPIANDNRTFAEISAERILFFNKIVPILKNIPKERFTPAGWKYFHELGRWW